MSELNEMKEVYLAVGIGGTSFIALLGVLYFILKSVLPRLNSIQEMGAVTQTVIQNNTRAVEEVAKSNQNVATALQILDKSMNNVHTDVRKTLDTVEHTEKMILVIDGKLSK